MKFRPLTNFNSQDFEDIEEAVCFNIYLGSLGGKRAYDKRGKKLHNMLRKYKS